MLIRLTAMTLAAVYGAMLHWGEAPDSRTAQREGAAAAPILAPAVFDAMPALAKVVPAQAPARLKTQVIPASVALANAPGPKYAPEGNRYLDLETLVRAQDAPPGYSAKTGAEMVEVTGARVNLRAGPSTGHAVRGQLQRGDRAVLVDGARDGWMRIRALDGGTEGFMSDDFLTEVKG